MSSCPTSFRGTNLKHTRDHVPIIQPPPMSKPKSDSAIDISGPRNPDLVSRRNQQTQQSDAEKYRVAFGGGTSKSRLFHTAAQNQLDKERRTHMMQRESQQIHSRHNETKASQAVELHLTPEPSKSNGLLAQPTQSKRTPSQLAHQANEKNGGAYWLHGIPLNPSPNDSKHVAASTPAKRTFSVAQTFNSRNSTPKLSTEPVNSNSAASSKHKFSTDTRNILLGTHPHLHPASNHLQDASSGLMNTHRHPSTIPPESFYLANGAAPSGSRSSSTASPHPLSSSSAADAFTPEPSTFQRATRSRANIAKQSSGPAPTTGDQSVVIIDSDDDITDFQSPKYTSPKTNSERKCVSDRMIPQNVVKSFTSSSGKEWMFAYPVKDCRGIVSNQSQFDPEAGDHCAILPYSKGSAVAYLFFTRNGDVVVVPEDGQRDFSLRARCPQKFSLVDCASVITTLNTEEKTDSKNEFQLVFFLKPHAAFTPLFDLDSKSDDQQELDDDGVVLVDDVTSGINTPHTPVDFGSSSTLGDTLCLQDTDTSVINVDDAKSFSSVGFKLQNPVFVDGCPSLKESEFTHNVKRFNEFIWNHIRTHETGRTGGVINVTSAYTHVLIGIPRTKPSNIVEDSTELLDYQVPEPEKSFSAASESSYAPPSRPKKSSTVHRVISVGDFARLDKGECLSDATIDFYSSWLRQTHPDKCRGIYFASSFFFKKLWSQQKDSQCHKDFSYMQKWNSIDIFTFDKVMFPVNLNYHWSLIVLENPGALLSQNGRCRLLYFDSLLTWDVAISQLFTAWICWMHMRKTNPHGEVKPLLICNLSLEGKRQDNTYDCGVFVLRYMERIALDFSVGFKPADWNAVETSSDVQYKRKELQRLIRKLTIQNLSSAHAAGVSSHGSAEAGEGSA